MADRLSDLEATIRDGIILRPDNESENPEADALDALAKLHEIARGQEAELRKCEALLTECEALLTEAEGRAVSAEAEMLEQW